MKRLLARVIVIVVVVTVVVGALGTTPTPRVQGQTAAKNVEILVALDISGSMDTDKEPGNLLDVGNTLRPDSVTATDRTNQRFETTALMFQWLSHLLQSRPELNDQLDIHASVMAFDQEPSSVADWMLLDTLPDDEAIDLEPPQPTDPGRRNSDFLTLYRQAAATFNDHETSGDTRRVFVVITDSVPCDPVKNERGELRTQEGKRVYSAFCDRPEVMSDHLTMATAALPTGVVPVILHISPKNFWQTPTPYDSDAPLNTTLTTWTTATENRGGRFVNLDGISLLPQEMFDVLAEQITLTLTGGNNTDQATIGQQLGLVEVGSTFEVPPYQEFLDVLLFTQSSSPPQITVEDDPIEADDTILASGSGTMRYLYFERPPAGEWSIGASGEVVTVRIMYRPARAELTWMSNEDNHQQYQPARLKYQILDKDDDSWIEENYEPEFTVSISPPEGDVISLDMSCSRAECLSEEFLPLYAGNYDVTFSAKPQDWPEITVPIVVPAAEEDSESTETAPTITERSLADQYSFLEPDIPGPLVVQKVTFWRQIENRPAMPDSNPNSTVRIEIPRSAVLSASVWTGERDAAAVMAPNITGELTYEGDGCLPDSQRQDDMVREDQYLVASEIEFDTGSCDVGINLYISSELKPLVKGEREQIGSTLVLANVDASSTALLTIALLDDDGKPLDITPETSRESERDLSSPEYSMLDYQTQPQFDSEEWVWWESDTLNIEIAFFDEDNKVIDPEFLTDTDDESTPSNNPENELIPFRFTLVSADGTAGDIAAGKDIALRKSEKEGIYVAELHDLEPGDYFVQFELLTEGPQAPSLNTENYEYDESLVSGEGNPILVAHLEVEENIYRKAQIYATFALFGVLALMIVRSGTLYYWRHVAPLSGWLAIYTWPKSDDEPKRVWTAEMPSNLNTYEASRSDLLSSTELTTAMITSIKASTQRNRKESASGGAHVTIKVNTKVNEYDLIPGMPVSFHIDPQGTTYYVAKFDSGLREIDTKNFKAK